MARAELGELMRLAKAWTMTGSAAAAPMPNAMIDVVWRCERLSFSEASTPSPNPTADCAIRNRAQLCVLSAGGWTLP